MTGEGLQLKPLLLRKAYACLRHRLVGVKPEKPDFTVTTKIVFNNFYLSVFIDLTFITGDNQF